MWIKAKHCSTGKEGGDIVVETGHSLNASTQGSVLKVSISKHIQIPVSHLSSMSIGINQVPFRLVNDN